MSDFYTKVKGNVGTVQVQSFLKLVDNVTACKDVVDISLGFLDAYSIMVKLSNNGISNKQEYCDTIIDTLQTITSYDSIFSDYFAESLTIVKEGVRIVIEGQEEQNILKDVYPSETKGPTIFSKQNFEVILHKDRWEEHDAPTIAEVLVALKGSPDDYTPAIGYNRIRDYIFFRINEGLENPQPAEVSASTKLNENRYGHSYEPVVVTTTCTVEGCTEYSCTKCGHVSKTTKQDKLPHDYIDTIVAPTPESSGYTLRTCKNCDSSYQDTFVDALQPPNIS